MSFIFGLQKTRDSLKEAFENLFEKYGHEFEDDEEIDIISLEVVKRSTNLRSNNNIQKPKKFGFLYKKEGTIEEDDEKDLEDENLVEESETDPTDLEKIFNERSNALVSVSTTQEKNERQSRSSNDFLSEKRSRRSKKKDIQLNFDLALLRVLELEISQSLLQKHLLCAIHQNEINPTHPHSPSNFSPARSMTISSEKIDYTSLPRAALLKSFRKGGEEFLSEETFSVIFDECMQNDLLSLLEFFKTSHSLSYEVNFSCCDEKYKSFISKFAQFTFLSKESLETAVIKPFFAVNKNKSIPEGEDLISRLFEFYHLERLATIKLISFLLKPLQVAPFKPEIVALCRTTLKSLLSRGLIEKATSQLLNLSSITLPTGISKENNNELAFMWIHQNILEQKELSKMVFELLNADYFRIDSEIRSKLILELIKNNFGLNNFEKYNLDSETVALAREAFWFRQSAAIRILDLKGLLAASVSSSNIITTLSPLKTSDLSKLYSAFKTEINHELTSPFKFSWSLLAGYLDSLDILENEEIKVQYPKIASKCIDNGIFKVVFDLFDSSSFSGETASTKTSLKSLFKDVYTSFLSIFDSERASLHFPVLTEGLVRIFTGDRELCEEFWYVDSQFPGRTSVLKHWINRFPHDFITLIRLLRSLSAGPTCSEIVSDFLLKGFDHIYLERTSDRTKVVEEFDSNAEVYNLTVTKALELHSCGVGFILDVGSKGVMMSGFNEKPMVNWSTKIYPLQFLLRILQNSQDFSVNYSILDLFESFMKENEDFAGQLYEHLASPSPKFSQGLVVNLPFTLIDSLIFILEQPNPNALILSKCLNCLVHFDKSIDLEFFELFMRASPSIMDGITKVLKRCMYNIEIDHLTFEIFDSVIKFSDFVLKLCSALNSEKPEDCSVLLVSLKESILSFIIEHVGKWRFNSQNHRVRLLSEVCRLVLTLEKNNYVSSTNFTLLNAIISLVHDMNTERDLFSTSRIFTENKIDVAVYFKCLTNAIESANSDESILAIAEYFGNGHVQTNSGMVSPFSIIADCLSLEYLVLPVLLFFQYVFQNDRFAMCVRISRDSLEVLSGAMGKWFKSESRDTLPRVRSAALAVLNNTACTRPDIFLFVFSQSEESFVKLFNEGISRNVFDYETKLLTGICSVLWNSVAEFTLVINALKKKASSEDSLVERMAKLLSLEWAESQTPIALQICSSVFEVLSVELCYFNLTQSIPKNISNHLKNSTFDAEKFVKKVALFQLEFQDSFLIFVESFSIFASSCLALKDETEFNRKLLPSLVLIIERLSSSSSSNWEFVEMTCKVLNFGLLSLISGKDNSLNSSPYSLLGHVHYNSLVDNFCSVLSGPCDDLNEVTDQRIELVCTFNTLLTDIEMKWTVEQVNSLFECTTNVLNVLRHLLVVQSRDKIKISSYLRLLIVSIAALTPSSDLIHFLRREGVLKTIFSLIRNYTDTDSLILFTSKIAIKYDFIVEELLSSEILESFIVDSGAQEAGSFKFFIEFISLLSVIKILFDSNCAVSERICTILYSCNIQGSLESIKKRSVLEARDFILLNCILPVFKLISSSLNRPIESQATEALFTNLLPCLFDILLKLTSLDGESFQNSALISELISTLATFNIYAHSKYPLRRQFQTILFPVSSDHQTFSPSQYASALNFIIISSKKFNSQCIEYCMQILNVNCPPSLKSDLEKSFKQ